VLPKDAHRSIPNALENTALLAALVHPNHIVCRGSLGFSRLPPPRDSNGFGYIYYQTHKTPPTANNKSVPCVMGISQ